MIDIIQWRITIGLWSGRVCSTPSSVTAVPVPPRTAVPNTAATVVKWLKSVISGLAGGSCTRIILRCFVVFWAFSLLFLSGDVELNPGPENGLLRRAWDAAIYHIYSWFSIEISEEKMRQWLSEGTIEIAVTRLIMHGPPGAGKTCAQRLLLNEPPPDVFVTDSTPIAMKATRASCIVDGETVKWETVDRNGLLERLASDLKAAALHQQNHNSKRSTSRSFRNSPVDVLNEICYWIPVSKAELSNHWVYIIDSGGQPAYQELLPLFVRSASVNIITIDLSKELNKKLEFQYRFNGKIFCDDRFRHSNRSFIESIVCSRGVLKPIDLPSSCNVRSPSHPMNLVLGTHDSDRLTAANLTQMNSELISALPACQIKEYVIHSKIGKSVIFPVNAILPVGTKREKAGEKIRRAITNSGVSLTIQMPVRWFAFELYLQKLAEKKKRSFLTKDEVSEAGRKLGMDDRSTCDALKYLHNTTIILYFPDISGLVFIDPQPILDVLSRLIALTYANTDSLNRILPPPVTLTESLKKSCFNLRDYGLFKEEFLEIFKSESSTNMLSSHFKPSHFIELLKQLRVIAQVKDNDKGDYFLPCALPSYGDELPTPSIPDTDKRIQPLLIVWQKKDDKKEYLPVPQGVFPLTVTHLLSHLEPYKVEFPQSSQHTYKYRDAITLTISGYGIIEQSAFHIINRYTHIEINFIGSKKYCPQVRELVTKAVKGSSANINITDSYVLAFDCPVDKKCYCVIEEAKGAVNCSMWHPRTPEITGENYWCWFKSPKTSADDGDIPVCNEKKKRNFCRRFVEYALSLVVLVYKYKLICGMILLTLGLAVYGYKVGRYDHLLNWLECLLNFCPDNPLKNYFLNFLKQYITKT